MQPVQLRGARLERVVMSVAPSRDASRGAVAGAMALNAPHASPSLSSLPSLLLLLAHKCSRVVVVVLLLLLRLLLLIGAATALHVTRVGAVERVHIAGARLGSPERGWDLIYHYR